MCNTNTLLIIANVEEVAIHFRFTDVIQVQSTFFNTKVNHFDIILLLKFLQGRNARKRPPPPPRRKPILKKRRSKSPTPDSSSSSESFGDIEALDVVDESDGTQDERSTVE